MTPQAQAGEQRHQDYVYSAPPLAAGALLQAMPFNLDADFPFELHGLAARIPYDPTTGTQTGLQFISMRWGAFGQEYRQTGLVPLPLLLGPYFGQVGNPRPVYPAMRFPRSGAIWIDLQNNGLNTITGLQIFFRGVKVGPLGSWPEYTYPQKQARPPLPFWYPNSSQQNAPFPIIALPVTGGMSNVPFFPENDSDFVLRFGQAGPTSGTWEVFITLKDEQFKPYSNAPVHADVLFGRSGFPAVFPCGGSYVAPVGPGASQPGLIVPEIYIPKNHKMWLDVTRSDAAYAGAVPVNYPITFGGMKVFPA